MLFNQIARVVETSFDESTVNLFNASNLIETSDPLNYTLKDLNYSDMFRVLPPAVSFEDENGFMLIADDFKKDGPKLRFGYPYCRNFFQAFKLDFRNGVISFSGKTIGQLAENEKNINMQMFLIATGFLNKVEQKDGKVVTDGEVYSLHISDESRVLANIGKNTPMYKKGDMKNMILTSFLVYMVKYARLLSNNPHTLKGIPVKKIQDKLLVTRSDKKDVVRVMNDNELKDFQAKGFGNPGFVYQGKTWSNF